MESYNSQEFYTRKEIEVGKSMMQYEDLEKELNGRKQYEDRIYEQTEEELTDKIEELRKQLKYSHII
tara:strand:- start:479 stop:679 length:201 start_codon:yes stop_codon:yes gene_type:complete